MWSTIPHVYVDKPAGPRNRTGHQFDATTGNARPTASIYIPAFNINKHMVQSVATDIAGLSVAGQDIVIMLTNELDLHIAPTGERDRYVDQDGSASINHIL